MNLFAELKRRNVIRVGIAYVVIAWVVAQVAELALDSFEAPAWVMKSVLLLMALGLPFALFFAWAFELTPEGIKKEEEVDRSQSITPQTGRKLDFLIIGVLSVALAWFAWDKFYVGHDAAAPAANGETAALEADIALPDGDEVADKSVAVLPFVAMSSGEDDEYFADGLTEEILNALAQLPELLVTARTSAFSFKGQELPVQEIAKALRVKHVVEGSVRRSGERLRVTAQLIRADDGFHLWSENYDSTSGDAIAVQEDIAEKIARALDIFLDKEKRRAMRSAGLRDVVAFTEFQKGLDLYNRAHGEIDLFEGLVRANQHLERVIARAPDFSMAYILHSDLFIHLLDSEAYGSTEVPPGMPDADAAYDAAIADYQAAVRHASSDAQRSDAEFNFAFVSGDWRGLMGRLERALQFDNCNLGNWMGNFSVLFGYTEAYAKRMKRVLACDPRRSLIWFNAARTAFWSGDLDEALRLAQEGSAVAPGNWLSAFLAQIFIAKGDFEEATRVIENRIQVASRQLVFKALIASQQRDRERFEALVKEHENVAGTTVWSLPMQAWGGNREAANRLAARIDAKEFSHFTLVVTAVQCACGAPWDIEATPRFAAKISEAGLPWPPPSPLQHPFKDW